MLYKALLGATALMCVSTAVSAQTLDEVRERDRLLCGVSQGAPGFSALSPDGAMEGLDADMCRAVAAAVLGDPEKIDYVQLSSNERFVALQAGTVDMLARTTTWTLSRDVDVGVDFVATNFYDGQGFLVNADAGIGSATELDGAAVCLRQGTTSVQNLADYFRANGVEYTSVLFEQADEAVKAYDEGRCDAYSIDRAILAGDRLKLKDPDAHTILPDVISKEPLSLAVRQNDSEWGDVVRWSFWALVNAEELGVTADNAAEMVGSDDPAVRRLLGADTKLCRKARPRRRFRPAGHPGRRQLRRDVRAASGRRQPHRPVARPERAVVGRRAPLRGALALAAPARSDPCRFARVASSGRHCSCSAWSPSWPSSAGTSR